MVNYFVCITNGKVEIRIFRVCSFRVYYNFHRLASNANRTPFIMDFMLCKEKKQCGGKNRTTITAAAAAAVVVAGIAIGVGHLPVVTEWCCRTKGINMWSGVLCGHRTYIITYTPSSSNT